MPATKRKWKRPVTSKRRGNISENHLDASMRRGKISKRRRARSLRKPYHAPSSS